MLHLPETEPALCMTCGDVLEAPLRRGDHAYGSVVVRNALARVCPRCNAVLAFPDISTGRIAQVSPEQRLETREYRVPPEAEDLALAVNAMLGTVGAAEAFTLPLHLGLQVAGREHAPKPSWKVFDAVSATERARPRVAPITAHRIDGLRQAWGAESVSQVARWLVVAAWEALQSGLTSRQSLAETAEETLLVSEFQMESVVDLPEVAQPNFLFEGVQVAR